MIFLKFLAVQGLSACDYFREDTLPGTDSQNARIDFPSSPGRVMFIENVLAPVLSITLNRSK